MKSARPLRAAAAYACLGSALLLPGCGKAFTNGCRDTLTCSQGADGGVAGEQGLGGTAAGGKTYAEAGETAVLGGAGAGGSSSGTGGAAPAGAPSLGGTEASPGGQGGESGHAGVPGVCGNGKTEPGEDCDNGKDNSNYGSCLPSCAKATCGDGYLWDGKEECDYNDPSTSSTCARSCKSSIWALWPMPNVLPDLPNQASYDTSVAGIVLDKITGLVWQRSVSAASYTWTEAKSYCEGLSLAGFSDWRLPTRIELVSLVTGEWNPSIDRDAFPSTPAVEFWSSSPSAAFPSTAWVVEFAYASTQGASMTSKFRARCVR